MKKYEVPMHGEYVFIETKDKDAFFYNTKDVGYHVYFLSEDKIEKNDYSYCFKTKTVTKCLSIYDNGVLEIEEDCGARNPLFSKKVVLTSDKKLKF